MKNIRVSPKLIELVKSNGKRLLCGIITCVALAIPHTGLAEANSEEQVVQDRIVEYVNYNTSEEIEFIVDGESIKTTIDLSNPELAKEEIKEILDKLNASRPINEYPSFFLIGHWEKSEKYDDVKKENDGREYKRTISCFRIIDSDPSKYENDIEKIGKDFRDDEKHENFVVVGEKDEYVVLTPEEEKELDTKKDLVMIEGSNIMYKVDAKEERSHGLNIGIAIMNSFNMARLLSRKRRDD